MRRFAKFAALLIGIFVFVAPFRAVPQVTQRKVPSFKEKLDKNVAEFNTGGRTLIESLLDIAYQHELPMGIEYLNRDALTRPIDLRFQNESIRGILIALTKQSPEYQVTFSDGLVDIFVPQARQDPSNLLNRVIKDFNVRDKDAMEANAELACALAQEIDPSRICLNSIAKGELGAKKITLHLKNASVYQLINAIVAQNENATWSVIVPTSRLDGTDAGDLWHIYPLQAPFKEAVLVKLSGLKP